MEKGGVSTRGIKILKKLRGIFHAEGDVDSAGKTFMARMESRGMESFPFRGRSAPSRKISTFDAEKVQDSSFAQYFD